MAEAETAVVSNSSPLIYLARIGRLGLVKAVYGKICVPEAVLNEAVTQGKALRRVDASVIEEAVGRWIVKVSIKPEVNAEYRFLDADTRLGSGEKEALKLCKQLNADYFIVDDKEARRVSRILKIRPIGTCGVLVQACRQGSIANGEAIKILDELVRSGFRIEVSVYRRVLRELRLTS
ncbi:MAG: DUF3368 domain-containing protein [Candidatus Bathyarchaeia archaeon]